MVAARALQISIGGKIIDIDSVLLHSAAGVAKWQGLLANAQPLLGNFSTGFGIFGSPGVALAGAVAMGLLESAVTNANQKTGFQLLAEAMALAERLRPRGVMVSVSEIVGVGHPNIDNWTARGNVESELDVRKTAVFDKKRLVSEYGATDSEIESGFIVRKTLQELRFFPDEFVTCRCGDRSILVKWSSVDSFEVI